MHERNTLKSAFVQKIFTSISGKETFKGAWEYECLYYLHDRSFRNFLSLEIRRNLHKDRRSTYFNAQKC